MARGLRIAPARRAAVGLFLVAAGPSRSNVLWCNMEQGLLVTVAVLLGLILVTLWIVLYQLVKQHGRILLRQDDVERRLVQIGLEAAADGFAGRGARPESRGLAPGAPFPHFRLPDLTGREVALEDFLGKRLLVIHWSPRCGFCARIAPDLARLQGYASTEANLQYLLIAHGDAASNRELAEEHGLKFPILLQSDDAPPLEAFRSLGTPVAYLLDEQGRIAELLAVGADRVLDLARTAMPMHSEAEAVAPGKPARRRLPGEKPLSESKIERNGLKAGTPAPPFRLPDVHGRMVALEQYRGRRVLLVFSDPHCGPCDQLAPHLARLHRQHRDNGLDLLVVGRGDPEENRSKAEAHGFEFPIVLQKRWELSKEYGIFATPVAFLIDEDGLIARDIAKGPDEILALARGAFTQRLGVEDGRVI
jgi:peroxiredoxin